MSIGIRTDQLRKVFTSPPPFAAQGRGVMSRQPRQQKRNATRSEIVALDDLSITIDAGNIVGLLGPNGAGKSTTVGILTTRVRATGGRAWVGDYDVRQDPRSVKRLIGVVPQRPNLDFSLTAREILTFHGAYFGMHARERSERADHLLEQFQLTDRADQLVRGFSGGMSQRLSIARAMMHDPEVLFLDEPSAGLDPQTRLALWQTVREFNANGKTVLLTTHNMDEADTLCRYIAIIDHGRIIAKGTPSELKRSVPGGYLIRLRFDGDATSLRAQLDELPGVHEVRASDATAADVYADSGGPLVSKIVHLTAQSGIGILEIQIAEPSLENLFLHHTGRSLRE
jgi:ABC-2 type transport system ATP-binding protein